MLQIVMLLVKPAVKHCKPDTGKHNVKKYAFLVMIFDRYIS